MNASLRLELWNNLTFLCLILSCLGNRKAAINLCNKGLRKFLLFLYIIIFFQFYFIFKLYIIVLASGINENVIPQFLPWCKECHRELGICEVKKYLNSKGTVTQPGLQKPRLFSLEHLKSKILKQMFRAVR